MNIHSSCLGVRPPLPPSGPAPPSGSLAVSRHILEHPFFGPQSGLLPSAPWIKCLALGLRSFQVMSSFAEQTEKFPPLTQKENSQHEVYTVEV